MTEASCQGTLLIGGKHQDKVQSHMMSSMASQAQHYHIWGVIPIYLW